MSNQKDIDLIMQLRKQKLEARKNNAPAKVEAEEKLETKTTKEEKVDILKSKKLINRLDCFSYISCTIESSCSVPKLF